MPDVGDRPIRVTVRNDYQLVVAGVSGLLAAHAERVVVVEEVDRLAPVMDVDVVLYDTFTEHQGEALDVSTARGRTGAKVVVFSWNTDPQLVAGALERGAAGYIPKHARATEIVEAIERVCAGEVVRPWDAASGSAPGDGALADLDWPGKPQGLTARESEVVALITQGLSNQEIADRCFLSINSIKTHVRLAYRKMGVGRRAEAVRWGIEHGFRPDIARRINP